MFLPTTREEIIKLGWERPDVILITGDAYIDSPHVGVAVIGKYLLKHGFTVAVIAQPSMDSPDDITRLGEPRLFWGVTGGCIDSMVANYTPQKKWRNQDDYTPGGVNIRPDRATMAYTNLIRRNFKNTRPIVLGGIEASLRRIAHYDYWDNAVRRSVLFDAKADIIAYGMAEKTMIELAGRLKDNADWKDIPGICYPAAQPVEGYIALPSFEDAAGSVNAFWDMFKTFYENIDNTKQGMEQRHGERWLIHNPARPTLTTEELDEICDLDFERDAHPVCKAGGEIRGVETIKQSITTHRGCFGQCSFCAIAVHQGRAVVSRSPASIIEEAKQLARIPKFNGIIYDVGGATANMYGSSCKKGGLPCKHRSCLMPQPCHNLVFGHGKQISLLNQLLKVPGIKKVFISTGIRHDMVVADKENGAAYMKQLVQNHVSGQIKLAPEHYDNDVLVLMNKPSIKPLMRFKAMFEENCRAAGKNYFMTYYLMAAHPGCTMQHMYKLKDFLKGGLRIMPEQVQIFTPTPSTLSAAMYYTGTDAAGNKLYCERHPDGKQRQKDILQKPDQSRHHDIPPHLHRPPERYAHHYKPAPRPSGRRPHKPFSKNNRKFKK